MKDYYKILGIPENANRQDIKSAFRKLAFQFHPDTNPGNEKQAEAKFKEINEAYAVLGDEIKKQQYDLARTGQYAGTRDGGGFNYSQQDIFNGMFTNQVFFDELMRMFSQSGLRFDRNFYGQTFANGTFFRFYTNSGKQAGFNSNSYAPPAKTYKPGWLERMASRLLNTIGRFIIKKAFGIEYTKNLDIQMELEIIPEEAIAGKQKEIEYTRGTRKKKVVLTLPANVNTGTRIRLKGMGVVEKGKAGDLYIYVKVKKQTPLTSG
ncbi:MAG: DnaJ domain-containing protein [Dehalococcoidales bacterium]|nr:DnaJ domain-containing protein [Dehalococcoidales bacterium]